jgi:vacuolar-type H+-ATPase subunit I/STV1
MTNVKSRRRSKSQNTAEVSQKDDTSKQLERHKEASERRALTPREESTSVTTRGVKKSLSASKSTEDTRAQITVETNKNKQSEIPSKVQANGDSGEESSASESSGDSDIFDESKFDKYIEEENPKTKDEKGDWALIQMIMRQINPKAVPIDAEDAIESTMLNLVLSEEDNK